MLTKAATFASSIALLAATAVCPAQKQDKSLHVKVQYENPIRNQRYPELLYWYVTPKR